MALLKECSDPVHLETAYSLVCRLGGGRGLQSCHGFFLDRVKNTIREAIFFSIYAHRNDIYYETDFFLISHDLHTIDMCKYILGYVKSWFSRNNID